MMMKRNKIASRMPMSELNDDNKNKDKNKDKGNSSKKDEKVKNTKEE